MYYTTKKNINFDTAINDEDFERAKKRYEKQGFKVEKINNLQEQIKKL